MFFARNILYLEESEDSSGHIKGALEPCCYNVVMARTVVQGLRLAENSYFDLYLIGSSVFDKAGFEFCRRIRMIDSHTPILIYSSPVAAAYRKDAMRAGAQGYLVGPVDPWELEETIVRLIAEAELKKRGSIKASGNRKPAAAEAAFSRKTA